MKTRLHRPLAPLLFALLVFSCGQFSAQTQTPPRPFDEVFKRRDKNGDGKLTRDETPNPESFAIADADRDGVVTLEEFRRYMAGRAGRNTAVPKASTPAAPAPIPAPEKTGEPPLKKLPDSDAVRDAAGLGQLFECNHVAGLTDLHEGMNDFAIADLNDDGRPDIVATFTPPVGQAGRARTRDKLRVFINEGGFRFRDARGIALSNYTVRGVGTRTADAVTLEVGGAAIVRNDAFREERGR